MAVAHEITAREARIQHQAYRLKNVAQYSTHWKQSKRVKKQHELQALQIDTEDYGLTLSYQGPVKPPQRQVPVTYAQASKPYHYRRPSPTDKPSLGPMRHHKTRYHLKEKGGSGTAIEQAPQTLHDTASNNDAAPPVLYPVLTEIAARLCVYFTSKGFCVKGAACSKTHDVLRTALCPSVLTIGESCKPRIDTCKLQHSSSPETVPTCFYQGGTGKVRDKSSTEMGQVKEQYITGSKTSEFAAQNDYVSLT